MTEFFLRWQHDEGASIQEEPCSSDRQTFSAAIWRVDTSQGGWVEMVERKEGREKVLYRHDAIGGGTGVVPDLKKRKR